MIELAANPKLPSRFLSIHFLFILMSSLLWINACDPNEEDSNPDTFSIDITKERSTFLYSDSVFVLATDSSFRYYKTLYADKMVDEDELTGLPLPKPIKRPYIIEVYVFDAGRLAYGRQIMLYKNELSRTVLTYPTQSAFPDSMIHKIWPGGLYP